MNKYLDIAPEVAEALAAGKPVVALESTIISHGMPYPQNVETALKVEQIIRDAGAVPATIAIIGGRLKAGLSKEEIDYLGRTGAGIPKASRRDLPVLVAQGKDGACTVTTTMMIADMAGIRVFATGGIGGVHRGAQETFDISADLEELANTSVMVVCAGAKSILDLGLTLEYLETHGVTVIGYGTSELPAFYTRKSGFGVDYELDTPEQLAKAFHVKRELGLRGGLLVTNPIPEEYSMDKEVIDKAIADEKTISDMECGEGFDRATLSLLGKQQELLKALKATGKPLIVVYIEGRPLDKNWASENADAVLTAYYPGQEGGIAIADVLFGDFNPAGRLPFSVPRSVGQIPLYYNKKAPQSHDYVEMSASPLYPFGYGLSYTSFDYSDLHLSALMPRSFEISFKVRNTGKYDGEEVAQLYLRDEYASVVQPLKQLKHFARFYLKRGEEREVKFILSEEDFSLVDRNLKRIVEPGTFQIMIGAASNDIRLQTKVEIK